MVEDKSGRKKKYLDIPGLEKNKKLIGRFAQLYVSEIDMKKDMYICHIGNVHHKFNLFVHGIYGENDKGEKERGITMMMLEHLERGEKVDMILIFPNVDEEKIKISPFNFTYTKKSKLNFKPEFFMISEMMDWELLTEKLGESIDNDRILKYLK